MAKAMQYTMTLLMGAAIVFFVIKPAVNAVGESMIHSAECVGNPSVANCRA